MKCHVWCLIWKMKNKNWNSIKIIQQIIICLFRTFVSVFVLSCCTCVCCIFIDLYWIWHGRVISDMDPIVSVLKFLFSSNSMSMSLIVDIISWILVSVFWMFVICLRKTTNNKSMKIQHTQVQQDRTKTLTKVRIDCQVNLRHGERYKLSDLAVTSDNTLHICNYNSTDPKVYIYKDYKTYADEISFTSSPCAIAVVHNLAI
jgi:hypothetical protein